MTKIKFEIEIDYTDTDRLDALQYFVSNLKSITEGGSIFKPKKGEAVISEPEKKEEKPEPEKPAKRKTKKAKLAEKEEKAELIEKTEKAVEAAEKLSDEERLKELRSTLSGVIQGGDEDLRESCVKKLKELDAKNPDTGKYNLSSLDPSKYDEFTEFLNSL